MLQTLRCDDCECTFVLGEDENAADYVVDRPDADCSQLLCMMCRAMLTIDGSTYRGYTD